MITKINIKGFKSLKNAEVEFYTNKNVADKNKEVVKKHKLLNNNFVYTFNLAGIIGANASGKTSFFDAIYIYQQIVINQFGNIKTKFKNFFEFEKKAKKFSFEYLINENIVKHEIICDEDFQIISEKLFFQEKCSDDNWKLIFDNKYKYSLLWRIAEISKYEKNETFDLNGFEINLINQLFNFIKNIAFFKNNWGIFEEDHYLSWMKKRIKRCLLEQKNVQNQEFLKLFKNLMLAADPNIINFEYDQLRDEIIILVRNNNKIIKVLLDNLSDGTKRFVFIMLPVLLNKNQASLYIIDEIENSFHPKIVDTILRLFYFNENNLNNSQLLFTTHNPYIFDDAEIHNNCINVSLYDSDKNFLKLSNFENYNVKRNDKLFSKNYILEIINSHPDNNYIDDIYEDFSIKNNSYERL